MHDVTNHSPLRIANCSGFYGDRFSAVREMLEGGHIDVLTGDYLAELTMLILWKSRQRSANTGYAVTFLRQMEETLATAMDRGVKIVANAGGLNPGGLATEVRTLAERLGLRVRVAHIEGDDVLGRLSEFQAASHSLENMDTGRSFTELAGSGAEVVTANAYLGAWGIVEALGAGADVVVCPRVTDASLVVGPAAAHFGWARDDWDRLAGAVVAGHAIECGPQVTGGNYAFFEEVFPITLGSLGSPGSPGFPLVEMHKDGSFVVTKHEGTGGAVSIGTVTAQLLYEIAGPRYLNPDAVARFDTLALENVGHDRVRVSGVVGEPAPGNTKICINYLGGYRNSVTFMLTGLAIAEKAALVRHQLFDALGGEEHFDSVDVCLIRSDRPDASGNAEAVAQLVVTVKDRDSEKVGRSFSNAAVALTLSSYPGLHLAGPPGDANAYGVYWPALIPADLVEQIVVLDDGRRLSISPAPRAATPSAPALPTHAPVPTPTSATSADPAVLLPTRPDGPTDRVPLGTIFGARSGDKGGNANVGMWARSDAGYTWLAEQLTSERFRELIPEASDLPVDRYEFPNLRALNFVVVGLLGEGVASSTRPDPQAKGLGEYLRSRLVDLPVSLLQERSVGAWQTE